MRTQKKRLLYPWLFGVNLFISTFTFGGGYVVVPMIRKYYVEKKHLFSEEGLLNMAAVAQSTPGAIAMNLSALAGYRTAGVLGVLVSCTAAVLPPLVILSILSVCYQSFSSNEIVAKILLGMQAGVAAVIVELIIDMFRTIIREKSWLFTIMAPCAFAANFILQVNVAFILLACAALCLLRVYVRRWKGGNTLE